MLSPSDLLFFSRDFIVVLTFLAQFDYFSFFLFVSCYYLPILKYWNFIWCTLSTSWIIKIIIISTCVQTISGVKLTKTFQIVSMDHVHQITKICLQFRCALLQTDDIKIWTTYIKNSLPKSSCRPNILRDERPGFWTGHGGLSDFNTSAFSGLAFSASKCDDVLQKSLLKTTHRCTSCTRKYHYKQQQ